MFKRDESEYKMKNAFSVIKQIYERNSASGSYEIVKNNSIAEISMSGHRDFFSEPYTEFSVELKIKEICDLHIEFVVSREVGSPYFPDIEIVEEGKSFVVPDDMWDETVDIILLVINKILEEVKEKEKEALKPTASKFSALREYLTKN